MKSASIVLTLFFKDLRIEWRNRETLSTICLFGLLVVFLFNFSFEPGREETLRLLPGLLWLAIAFVGIWGCNRSFVLERENQCLEGLTLAPIDPGLIYLGKLLANLFFMLVAEVVIVFATSLWYQFSFLASLGRFLLIGFLGTLAYVSVGTLFAAISANTRMREVMLPILQFPVVVPVLVCGIEATSGAMRGNPASDDAVWLRMLFSFAVIFSVLSYLLFEYVLEE